MASQSLSCCYSALFSSSPSRSRDSSSLSVATAGSPATAPPGSRQRLRPLAVLAIAAGLALVAWLIYVRSRALTGASWIDEGLSIGVSLHTFYALLGVLRQAG